MLRVSVLGDLRLEVDENAVELPASRRARSLLGWLTLDRRTHSRSELAARFWPDVLDESARTSLRSALWALRRALGPGGEQYVIASRDEVGLADDELVWTDVAEFDRLISDDRLEEALQLSRGELLTGLDDDWVYERRDEHRDRVAGVLAELAARAERANDLQAAISFTRRQAALDLLAEEPQRELMQRLAAAGDRSGAIRVYERFSQRLRDELRIVPSAATRALAETLRRGAEQPDVAAPSTPETPTPVAPVGAVVTLLFTDLVGSTELLGQLGDDEAERLRRTYFGLLRDVSTAHGGQEVKNLGDGLMVAFTSAVDAVSCAIHTQQAVHRHNAREQDDRLRVRVGLNVGEPIRDEGDYFGTPVVVAKRLCDEAAGGQILASDLLRGLVGSRGGFEFRPRGLLDLKGISEPVAASEVSWSPASEHRVPLPSPFVVTEPTAFVGRGAVLQELRQQWQQARDGDRRVAMLAGEPGIGKTRLAAEFCRAVYNDDGTVLLGRCYEGSLVPYEPFVEALTHYLVESPVDERRLGVGPHRETLAKLIPELADQRLEPAVASGSDDTESDQFRLFDAVASLLREVAAVRPLVLVLDDLHWADASTMLLLRHVARSSEHAALLILGTYRETEVDAEHSLAHVLAEMRRGRVLSSVHVRGLGEDDVAELIASQAGREAPAAFAQSVAERTEGNPFFVEEVLRDLSDEDWAAGLERIGVPESVKDLLLRRLRRLDETCKRLLSFASVIGREFELAVLERVSETPAEEVAESLEQAIAAQAIVESPESIGHYGFAHALIHETVYEQLSGTRRAQLHRRTGEALERAFADGLDEHAATLARHFSAAGELSKAYDYHVRAAASAQSVYAIEPALRHYTAALDAGAALGLKADDEPAIRELRLQLGRMRFRVADYQTAESDFEAVLDSARRTGDRAMEMKALNELGFALLQSDVAGSAACHEAALEIAEELGDTAAEVLALDRLSVASSHLLQLQRARELGERALRAARATGEREGIGRAIDGLKLVALQLGDLVRLEALTQELIGIWREQNDLWYLQFALLESAFVPIGRARWDEAAARLAEAVAINRRVSDSGAEALILDGLCWYHRSRGDYGQALNVGRRAVTLSTSLGWEGWTSATLGCVLLELGDVASAAAVLERGAAAADRVGTKNDMVRCQGQLASARWLLGAHEEASAIAAAAERVLDEVSAPDNGAFLFGVHAYAALGRVHVAAGEPDRAEALVSPILAAAERAEWCEAAATAGLVLGLCKEAGGAPAEAATVLTQAAALADRHNIPAPGWEAHAALSRMHRIANRAAEADEQLAHAEAIVERVTNGLEDEGLRAGLRQRVKAVGAP